MKNKSEVVNAINSWGANEDYAAAIIFGSFATGSEDSDVDLFIVTYSEKLSKPHTSKLTISGKAFDVTFLSMSQLISMIKGQVRSHSFKPQILDSIIVFDKTNRVTALKTEVEKDASPADKKLIDFSSVKYALYEATDAIEKNIAKDPDTALLLMHEDVGTLIKYHFRLNEKWQLPTKKTLSNLADWDKEFTVKLKNFLKETDPSAKFGVWKTLVKTVGDQMNSKDNGLACNCELCQENLNYLNTAHE